MKFKRFEIAMLVGLIVSVIICTSGVAKAQTISEKLVRLHIIANSDSEADQNIKLEVRNKVVPLVETLTVGCNNATQAEQIIHDNMDKILDTAQEVLTVNGINDKVSISIDDAYFPTKDYGNFSLPAGEYRAVRIIIGEGKGKNWWCVLFPPLCVPAAQEQIDTVAADYGLSEDDVAFISSDGYSYTLKFKSAELYGEIKEWICKHFNGIDSQQ